MKLYELLSRHGNFEIIESLVSEYPDARDSREGYILALHELRTLKPAETQCQILVHLVPKDEFSDEYVSVSGRGKYPDEPDTNIAIEFDPWEEWLGMEIMPESFEGRSEIEVLAHILWEMTFCGYSNKEVQDARKGLEDSYDEYRDGRGELVNLDDEDFE